MDPIPPQIREPRAKHRTIWIVLPAYNEEAGLPLLLRRIDESLTDEGFDYQVVVVDDGSTDRTAEVAMEAAARFPVIVESHPHNLGLGATIRDGILIACEKASDRDVPRDPRCGQYSHTWIDRPDGEIDPGGHHVVSLLAIGRVPVSAAYRPSSAPQRAASLLMTLMFPIKGVRDYTCGYRGLRRGHVAKGCRESETAFFNQDGFQVMVDILLKFRREPDVIFGEVPLILNTTTRTGRARWTSAERRGTPSPSWSATGLGRRDSLRATPETSS